MRKTMRISIATLVAVVVVGLAARWMQSRADDDAHVVDTPRVDTAVAASTPVDDVVRREDATRPSAPAVAVARLGSVTGRVVTTDGKPIAGATVSPIDGDPNGTASRGGDMNAALAVTRCGADGKFVCELAAWTSVRLIAGAPGFAATDPWSGSERDRAAGPWTIFADRAIDVGDLVLREGGRATGKVVDDAGAPIAGAVIAWAEVDRGNRIGATAMTAADGTFVLADLPARRVRLDASAPGFLPTLPPWKRVRALPGQTTTGVDFVLQRGVRVAGRVVDAGGTAQAGLRVESRLAFEVQQGGYTETGNVLLERTQTDAAGRFVLNVPRTSGSLDVHADGEGQDGRVRLALDALPPEIVVTIAPRREWLVTLHDAVGGGLVDPTRIWFASGRSVEEVVPIDSNRAEKNRFAIVGTGKVRIVFADGAFGQLGLGVPGRAPGSVEIPAGASESGASDVVLQPGVEVDGRVVRSATRDPVAGALVTVWKLGDSFRDLRSELDREPLLRNSRMQVARAVTDADGAFRLLPWILGDFFVTVESAEAPTELVDLGHLEPGGAPRSVEVVLHGGGIVVGTLSDARGRPLVGALTFLRADGTFRSAQSDASGSYRVGPLAAGAYRVAIERPYSSTRHWTSTFSPEDPEVVTVVDGAEVRFDVSFALMGRGAITGSVLVNGAPFAFETVQVSAADIETQTDATGRFELIVVPAGRQLLEVVRNGEVVASRVVTVEAGHVSDVMIDVTTGSIAGRVTARETGAPLRGAIVEIARVEPTLPESERVMLGGRDGAHGTEADGTFRFDDLECGRYHVVVRGPPGSGAKRVHEDELTLDATTHTLEVSLAIAGHVWVTADAGPNDMRRFRIELKQSNATPVVVYSQWMGSARASTLEEIEPGDYVATLTAIDEVNLAVPKEVARVLVESGKTAGLTFTVPPSK